MEEENSFLSKISRWDDKSRGSWQWEHRPSHRSATIAAAKQRESLDKKIHADLAALKDVETSLSVLTHYVDGDHTESADDKVTSPINLSDCQRLKAAARQRAQAATQQRQAKETPHIDTIDKYSDELVTDLVAKRRVTVDDHTFLTGLSHDDEAEAPEKPTQTQPLQHKLRLSQPSVRSQAQSTPNLHLPRQLKQPPPPPPKVTISRDKQLELAERQYQWMQEIEMKRLRAKMEKMREDAREVRDGPRIHYAQRSWEIAKRNHAKQTAKQAEKVEIKQKMEDMKRDMRRLRIEEKMLQLQQLEAQNNKAAPTRTVKRRVKKIKKQVPSSLELLPNQGGGVEEGSLILAGDAFELDETQSADEAFFQISPDKTAQHRHIRNADDASAESLDIEKISLPSAHRQVVAKETQPDTLPDSVSHHYQEEVSPLSTFTGRSHSTISNAFSPPRPRHDENRSTVRFFDPSSTEDKGRYRVHDARDFDTKSMFRKRDVSHDGVTLLMGTKRNSNEVGVITVLFDRHYFTEHAAKMWWDENAYRLSCGDVN